MSFSVYDGKLVNSLLVRGKTNKCCTIGVNYMNMASRSYYYYEPLIEIENNVYLFREQMFGFITFTDRKSFAFLDDECFSEAYHKFISTALLIQPLTVTSAVKSRKNAV